MIRVRMSTWVWATLLLAVFLTAGVAAAQTGTGRYATDELIIKFKPNTTETQKQAILTDIGAYNTKSLGFSGAEFSQIASLTTDNAITRYENHPDLVYIEPNYILTINEVPDDPRFDELYGMQNLGQTGGTAGADISATNAWDVFTGSSDVVVGVIDTGVDYTHPDLAANAWTNPGEIAGNDIDDDGNGFIDDIHGWDFVNDDNDPMDDNGHGTHCSGTIGGVGNNGIGVAGVNWNVQIMGLKFLSAGGSGSTADAIEALEYATMMGVRLTSNSWGGGGFSQAMYDAIADAQANNILFIAAAGNSSANTDATPHYPSSYDLDNIIAVSATDHNDELAGFSSYGATTVDLAAPGVDILSTLPGNSYGSLSGTSMATPHVAGAAALVFGRFPAISGADAKSLLLNFADPLPSLDGVVLTGARLNVFMPIAEPDSIAPGRITDLMVANAGSNWIDAQWTSSGDDGYTGTASRYDVRWSNSPIDDVNWDLATPVNGAPDPQDPGFAETMRITGLDFNTTYYLGVRAVDEFGNTSPASNSPMGATLGAPDVATNPLTLNEALLTGDTSVQTITLSNAGEGTLDFVIPTPTLMGAPVMTAAYEEVPKGNDTRLGEPVITDAGGPDAFGYRWVDSNDPMGPVFAWEDISGYGNIAMSTGDDVSSGPFALSFAFPFYGGDHTEFHVASNGFISLTSDATSYGNQQLPNPGAPAHLIAPFWDDLEVADGTVYYYDDGARLIVQWDGVSHYGEGGPYSFQAILNADGSVVYQYAAMAAPLNSATIGLQNGAGTDGLQVAFNTDYVADGLAIRMWAIPQWMTVTPSEGTVWAGGSVTLNVNFDAAGLVGGAYDGVIRVVSNDPDNPDYGVPVSLVVTGAPDIAVDPAFFDYGDLFLGASAATTVTVRNAGTDLLTISGITLGDGAFVANMSAFTLNPGQAQPVEVVFTPAAAQLYSTTMTVASDDPTDPVVTVSLTGAGLDPPQFAVDPTSLASNLLTGESETQVMTFTNSGGADFEFDLGIDFHADVTVHEYVAVGKEEIDARAGDPVIAGSGGPDIYGYRWIDSDEAGGPTFDWTDISATGTSVFSGTADDSNEGPFPIGFDFGFYGDSFNSFNVCSNGFISFTSTSTSYSNQDLPNSGAPENLLAPFWDDLRINTTTGANVFYQYDGARLIVQFHRVPAYYATGEHTFQVVLYPDGTIVYQYLTMDSTDLQLCTVGIQNGARDDGMSVAFNTPYVKDGLAVRFQAFPEWLTVVPSSGVVPPGGTLPVEARFNASGLFGGAYNADIVVDSNDPSVPTLPVPAVLNVTGAPDLQVSATAFDFGEVYLGTPTLQNLVVGNAGTDDLLVTGVSVDNPVFNTSLTAPLTLGPTQSLIATVGFVPDVNGPLSGTLILTTNDPDQPTLEISLAGVGLEPPEASVVPTTLAADLFTGQQETQELVLSNTGQSDLVWSAHTLLGASDVVVHAAMELAKEEADPRPGILGSGGPDLYGYRWTDSDEAGGPLYEWTDISATGTPVFSGVADDTNTGPFPIGFTFPFYGTPFTDFRVSSNGFITFTSTLSDYGNAALPGTGAPENLLAIFHDDLRVDTSAGSNVYYETVGNKLIVQYDQVPKYYANGALTFQAHLYPNGAIFYYYQTMVDADLTSATIGIQNATRDDGLTVVYNDAYMHDNMAIRLAPVSDWLTVAPVSGTLTAGANAALNVTFDAAELFGGDYDGAVRLVTNDPQAGLIEVPAALHVTGVPVLAVEPAAPDFGDVYFGFSEQFEIVVSNVGTDVLTVTDMISSKTDYVFTPTVFDLDPFESQVVTVVFTPIVPALRTATLTITSNDASSPTVVNLNGNGVNPPVAVWTPESFVGAAMPGGRKVKEFKLRNIGAGDLHWNLSASESMASATVQYPFIDFGKEMPDPRAGILGSGGPDTFGHTWIDSDDPEGPTFVWNDISGVGTACFGVYGDDSNEGPFPVGFDFPFYGNDFAEFNVSSNGFISFTSTSSAYSNQPLPNAGGPENLLAVFWDDMVVDPVARDLDVYYHNDGEKLVVQFDIRRIGAFDPPYYSFQAWMYPNGNIMYLYNTLGANTTSATIGIQNGTNDDGLMAVYNDDYVHEGLAILFQAVPAWLTVSLDSGTIVDGGYEHINVIMDASHLEPGDHNGTLTLTSNDPAAQTVTVDVLFHVDSIDVAASALDPDVLDESDNVRWIMGYVELPVGYDPLDVDISTVRFNGVVPADETHYWTDGDFNQNGIADLTFKFCREDVEAVLPIGDAVDVQITGEITDTTVFVATNSMRVIAPELTSPNGGEVFGIGGNIAITWNDPVGRTVEYAHLYVTMDDGVTWEPLALGVHGTSYLWETPTIESEMAKVRVFVFDAEGLMGSDISDDVFALAFGVSGVGDSAIPTVYALKNAYPNPFNPQTKIAYDLPKPGRTKVAVYDVMGRLVKELVNESQKEGSHEVTWFGRDGAGRQVASGVYYYRITSRDYKAVKPMTLIK